MQNTYFIDIDGVLIEHKGSLSKQLHNDNILPYALDLLEKIELLGGRIILTTGRKESMRKDTEKILNKLNIFYDQLVMGCNRGGRIIINDSKPSSTIKTAYAFTVQRNSIDLKLIDKIVNPYIDYNEGSNCIVYCDNYSEVQSTTILPGSSVTILFNENLIQRVCVINGLCSVFETQLLVGTVVEIDKDIMFTNSGTINVLLLNTIIKK